MPVVAMVAFPSVSDSPPTSKDASLSRQTPSVFCETNLGEATTSGPSEGATRAGHAAFWSIRHLKVHPRLTITYNGGFVNS